MSSTDQGSGPGNGQDSWPFDRTGAQQPPAKAKAPAPAAQTRPLTEEPGTGRRKPPLWLLVGGGVLVVGLAVVAVLVLGNRGGPAPETPVAETVTLPVPTPTVDAVAREAGTAFSDALPSTVLTFALTELVEEPSVLAAGAVEAYRLAYSDGGSGALAAVGGQWATPEAAEAAYQAMVAQQVPELGADLEVEEGAALVAGTEVGRYTLVPRADGSGTVTWRNGTVVVQVDGPATALADVFAAFPL